MRKYSETIVLQGRCSKYDKKWKCTKETLFFRHNTPQAPERRLVIMLCMSGLLNFHSHDIVGFTVTEDVELTVVDEFAMVS